MNYKILLDERELPEAWYNIQADLPRLPKPPLHPVTGEVLRPEDLSPIFPPGLIEQELTRERWIPIPEEVREVYRLWRPSPLFRAHRLEKYLGTPAHIYYKYEGVSPAGSHKLNTAVPQAFFNSQAGIKRLATETGAGQWGSALSMACRFFGLECTVYMVKVSYDQKPYRRILMQLFGAEVLASPSPRTRSGQEVLAQDPDSPGSLGIAISEAVEDAATHADTNYALGSVLNHVLLHQTVIGLESKRQMEKAGEKPDIVIGCVGGGSNFAGLAFPWAAECLAGRDEMRFIAVEPAACPTLTKGLRTYDHGDVAGLTPLLFMHTLGRGFIPPAIHAGGLRYHGDAPLLCQLVADGLMEARAYGQRQVFEAAATFIQTEGILPAPESAHAIKAVIDEALAACEAGEKKVILFNLSGHGHFDLAAYQAFLEGRLEDYALPEEKIRESLASLPQVEKP
ncbi:TrpB-like pyridoxal phosphate-dependent enzyme [Desulfothermobacter acidiphilus]|uniref:TrpB-like pyridoxal phosphate-dependent enzyme n=1 Tax=Desulfothermobacter acidiphilus TaxID=1938353 RepID=UPI003F897F9A